jgi:hypothetical protein
MPTYTYEYEDKHGEKHCFERRFSMSCYPQTIEYRDVDDEIYEAHLVISPTARMSINWNSYEPSDLPPTDHPVIE